MSGWYQRADRASIKRTGVGGRHFVRGSAKVGVCARATLADPPGKGKRDALAVRWGRGQAQVGERGGAEDGEILGERGEGIPSVVSQSDGIL
jgi:hypothetical protein